MNSKKLKREIKISSNEICPKCGENYYFYIDKSNRKKGLLFGEYVFEGLFDTHYGKHIDCYSCGNHWKVRKDKKSLLIKLLPFLENK